MPSKALPLYQDDKHQSLAMAYAKSCTDPIDFTPIFNELQSYKNENNGSLTIPPSHLSYATIIDCLTDNNVDSAIRKRWLQFYSAVQSLELGHELPASNNMDLVKWIQTQLDHMALYKDGLPNPLDTRQIEMLGEIGVQSLLKLRSLAEQKFIERREANRDSNDGDIFRADTDSIDESNAAVAAEMVNGAKNDESVAHVKVKEEETHESQYAPVIAIKHETANDAGMQSTEQKVQCKPVTLKGKCDICRKKDGHQGHNLQQCKDCGLKVHELCYGLITTDGKNPDFICHACKAVGTQIEVNVPSSIGPITSKKKKREYMTQDKRPTECILCSHDDGSIHAMHPIWDTHGEDGRQLVLPKTRYGEKRLAWAHTLCASFICSNKETAGCVYGLDSNYEYHTGDDEEDSEKDDSDEEDVSGDDSGGEQDGSGNSEHNVDSVSDTKSTTDDEDVNLSGVSAYAIAAEPFDDYVAIINQYRKLKCIFCGNDDKKSLRIPVQCVVNDEKPHAEYFEFKEWRQNHAKQHAESGFCEDREAVCSVAMHVGCARWGADLENVAGKAAHLVYFYTGRQQGDDDTEVFGEPVANCYCPAHAREVILGNPKNATKLPTQDQMNSEMHSKRKSSNSSGQPPNKRNKTNPQRETPSRKAPCDTAKMAPQMNDDHKSSGKRNTAAAVSQGKVPSKKKLKTVPRKRNHSKPFGKRESTVAISDIKDEDFVVLGRASKALSQKRAEEARKAQTISLLSANTSNSNETQVRVATMSQQNSLKNILGKVSHPAAAHSRPPQQARSNPTHPVQFSGTLEAPAAHTTFSNGVSRLNHLDNSSATVRSSNRAPAPVGILKKKGPGPIVDSYTANDSM